MTRRDSLDDASSPAPERPGAPACPGTDDGDRTGQPAAAAQGASPVPPDEDDDEYQSL